MFLERSGQKGGFKMLNVRSALVAAMLATVVLAGVAASEPAWAKDTKPAAQTPTPTPEEICRGKKGQTACRNAVKMDASIRG